MSSSDRKPYQTASTLDQDLLDACADNLHIDLRMILEVETEDITGVTDGGLLRASDENIYVGDHFYPALVKFPNIKRTIGEYLSPALEFGTLKIEVSNADGRFNQLVPGGDEYKGWVGRTLEIKMGLAENGSTYKTIFKGLITEVSGFQRGTHSITLSCRNSFEKLKKKFPTNVYEDTTFPNIEEKYIGKTIPVIYGDWGAAPLSEAGASVPVTPVNSALASVIAGTANLKVAVSDNTLQSIDSNNVYVIRSDQAFKINAADITAKSLTGVSTFEMKQSGSGGTSTVDGAPWIYKTSDKILIHCVGKDLGAYDDNFVEQARDIMITYGGLVSGDFTSGWNYFRDKNSPTESAISTFKSRIYLDKPQSIVTYALSLLEQVRLEAFPDKDFKFGISSTHFDEFDPTPDFVLRNWQIVKGSFKPHLDSRNNFNRTQGFYNRLPDKGEEYNSTLFKRNQDSIDDASLGVPIEKGVVFPNMYDSDTCTDQVEEILKLNSAFFEVVEVETTWQALLLDVGDFIALDVNIGSSVFDRVPCLIREIGFDKKGLKVILKLWSFQLVPFTGYTPGFSGTVGGESATITTE